MSENTQKLIRTRRITGRIAGALLLVCLLCIADGLTATWRTPFNTIFAVAGESFALNGPLPKGAESLSDVKIEGSSPQTWRLNLEKLYKGFWFGGLMWKGEVLVAPAALAGDYRISVRGPGKEPPSPLTVFTLRIFLDKADLRRKDPSFFFRLSGVRPFMAAWILFIAGLVTGGIGFLLSRKIHELYRHEGKSEIFLVERKPEGVYVNFSLGKDKNVEIGMDVKIENEDGEVLADARVTEVKPCDSRALLSTDCKGIRPGLVARLLADGQ